MTPDYWQLILLPCSWIANYVTSHSQHLKSKKKMRVLWLRTWTEKKKHKKKSKCSKIHMSYHNIPCIIDFLQLLRPKMNTEVFGTDIKMQSSMLIRFMRKKSVLYAWTQPNISVTLLNNRHVKLNKYEIHQANRSHKLTTFQPDWTRILQEKNCVAQALVQLWQLMKIKEKSEASTSIKHVTETGS